MDGIVVTLLVLVAGFALIVQPIATGTSQSLLATVVDFSYPVLDVLIGAILGVYGLLVGSPTRVAAHRVCRVTMAAADAAFAVQQARGVASDGHYEFRVDGGALAVALAAWVRAPDTRDWHQPVTGMRAIALALVAQALAIGIQIYMVFAEVGKASDRHRRGARCGVRADHPDPARPEPVQTMAELGPPKLAIEPVVMAASRPQGITGQ